MLLHILLYNTEGDTICDTGEKYGIQYLVGTKDISQLDEGEKD